MSELNVGIRIYVQCIAVAVGMLRDTDPTWTFPNPDLDKQKNLLVITADSGEVQKGYCDREGYWIVDDLACPCWPLLVKERDD